MDEMEKERKCLEAERRQLEAERKRLDEKERRLNTAKEMVVEVASLIATVEFNRENYVVGLEVRLDNQKAVSENYREKLYPHTEAPDDPKPKPPKKLHVETYTRMVDAMVDYIDNQL